MAPAVSCAKQRSADQSKQKLTKAATLQISGMATASIEGGLRYWDHLTLWSALQSLVTDAHSCMAVAGSPTKYDKALRRRGFLCNHQVYQAALHGMQVTRGMHKLRLPGSSLKAASAAASTSQALAVSSADHLLGVQPQELLAVQMPELKRTQKGCQALLPQLESRLKAQAQQLAEWTEHQGPLSQLPEHVVALVQSVKQGQEELLQGQQAQAGLAAQHLHTLRDLVEGLVTLLHDHILGSQQAADQAQCSLLTAQSSHMATKLKAMESKLLAATYTQDSVSAMESIAGHLDEEMHHLKSKNQQLTACLSQYEPLGQEFMELAGDYRNLLEDLEHAEFALEEFRKIAEGNGQTP